jgi:translation initiation factor IF-1
MAKEELLEFEGEVTEELPDGNFRVKLDNEHVILAYTPGKMRKFRIPHRRRRPRHGRDVAYDLARGRITFRHKSAQPTTAATGQRRAMWRKRG